MNQRPDYGSKGCCGPAAYGVLLLTIFSLTAAVRVGRKKSRGKR